MEDRDAGLTDLAGFLLKLDNAKTNRNSRVKTLVEKVSEKPAQRIWSRRTSLSPDKDSQLEQKICCFLYHPIFSLFLNIYLLIQLCPVLVAGPGIFCDGPRTLVVERGLSCFAACGP